ncbi:MAG: hypothetical protein KDK37_00860 [Leptospiraceae bacterium]|nr:hypothetical protein [Leptospiraceae bacterium]MCB1302793.1 hypothetical protein [Leptospiraceae bacterium]
MIHHLPIIIPLIFLAAALILPLAALIKEELSQPLASLFALIVAGLSIYGFLFVIPDGPIRYFMADWKPPIGIEFVYDGLSAFLLAVINSVAVVVLIHSRRVYPREFPHKQMPFYTVCMLLLFGFNGMVLTGDMFTLFVFLEISSLASYALIAIGGRPAPFAAFRYLIIGTVGGSLYLLGLGFLYNVAGTLNMIDFQGIMPRVATQPAIITGVLLMIVGIGLKAALFPMHGWLPDAYTHASSTSTALIAPIGTKVAAYVVIRLVLFVFGVDNVNAVIPVTTILSMLAAAGIIYGSIMAIGQWEQKRMLAYSSVSQIGYIFMGFTMGSPIAFVGALLHILYHAIMKAGLFLVSANIRLKAGHSDIRQFDHTFHRKYPWTMAAFTLCAVSMIGLPPMAGFFSKWYLAIGSLETGQILFLVVLLASSLLNAVYFFRIIEKVYLKNPGREDGDSRIPSQESASLAWPALGLAVLLLVFGLGNVWLVDYIQKIIPVELAAGR